MHLPASVRAYLYLSPCDMRRRFDGLHALALMTGSSQSPRLRLPLPQRPAGCCRFIGGFQGSVRCNHFGQSGTIWASLRASEDNLVAATRAELAGTLSAGGLLAVSQWVLGHVKQHIVIYGELPSSSQGGK